MSAPRPAGLSASVAAQAKVNLRLRILARERSGYHAVETIFHRLELADSVRVRVDAPTRSLDCAGPAMPSEGLGPVERNLAWRAALAYAERAGWPTGFAIEIEKRIPVGGGLGGGSADAGAVLRALDALAPQPLGARELLRLATPLGADVPFLAGESPMALAWGRGERMLALPALPQRDVTLLVGTQSVATADAYRWLAESRGDYEPEAALVDRDEVASWEGIAALAANDFEPVVGARVPEIARLLDALRRTVAARPVVELVLMSGSGATVFAVSRRALTPAELPAAERVLQTRTASRVEEVQIGE